MPRIHGQVVTLVKLASDGMVMNSNKEGMEGVQRVKETLENIMKTEILKVGESASKTEGRIIARMRLDFPRH